MTKNHVLKLINIKKSYGDKAILKDVSLSIVNEDRIGLVGLNGAGKTTLANVIYGSIEPDEGLIERQINLNIGYLRQSDDYKFFSFELLHHSENPHAMLQHTSKLGLNKISEWSIGRFNHLSGGEGLKLALAELWKSEADLLLLDEPTNHLDSKGIEWLIQQIDLFKGPVIIISHDRHFLDRTVNRVVEIENGSLHEFEGNYSDYRLQKKLNHDAKLHQYNVQERKNEKIEEQMDQLKRWSISAHIQSTKQGPRSERKQIGYKEYHRMKAKKMDKQVKSKMKRLTQELEKRGIDKPKEEATVHFQFEHQGKRGKRIIDAHNILKNFDKQVLFTNSSFYMKHGEKIALIGENGCGKTTLIKMILGEEPPSEGDLWVSGSIKIAYLSQDLRELSLNKKPLEALGFSKLSDVFRARTMLANLGIHDKLLQQEISALSLGERTKVKLVDLLMKEYDLLILDEPTNHLDLPSREQLEHTLAEYSGSLIVVSHDRYFIEKVCDKQLVFKNKQIKRVEKSLEEFDSENSSNGKQLMKSTSEEMLVIENRISAVLGELSILDRSESRYLLLDQEYKELLEKKRRLSIQ